MPGSLPHSSTSGSRLALAGKSPSYAVYSTPLSTSVTRTCIMLSICGRDKSTFARAIIDGTR